MPCVLDSSVTLAWVLPNEATDATTDLLAEVARSRAVVPSLWLAEVGNVLLMAERRKQIAAADRLRAMRILGSLPISIEAPARERIWHDAYDLAASHRLTVYDALYLEAALRLSLPLATLDRDLARAATSSGVTVLGQ